MHPARAPEPADAGDGPHRPLDAPAPLRAAVVGASGYIGTNLVPRLLAGGHSVRALARRPAALASRDWPGAELVAADVLAPATLGEALAGMQVAFYLVHAMRAGGDFGRLEREGAANFARAAAEAGLERIVYLGALLPAGADSAHLRSRRATGECLREGPVPVTEIRAGIVVGPGSAAFEVIRDLVNNLPVMVTPRWVRSTSPPIALENLLDYLVRVAQIPEAAGGIYDAAGPEQLSYADLITRYGEVVGKRPVIVPVPVLTPRLSAYWLRLVTAVPAEIARALVDGLEFDLRADDAALRRLVPQRLLDYREAVRAALDAERRATAGTRWTEGALAFRGGNPDHAWYAKRASGSAVARASPAAVWAQVRAIGGDNRYYYADALWTVREAMDWAIGGPGMRRGRRHPTELRVGDTIDSWRVLGVEDERRLTLGFGMKAPGSGVLEIEVAPVDGTHTRVTATAYWHPAGALGLLYWYALAPSHRLIFDGLTRAIARRAEAAA